MFAFDVGFYTTVIITHLKPVTATIYRFSEYEVYSHHCAASLNYVTTPLPRPREDTGSGF